ncbi:MAG: prolipoprotein diacylglyceryl transferase [Mycobacterium sp.]
MTTTVLAYIPSPSQGVWQLGPLPLRAYALFIIAGIIAALVIGDRRWVARGGEPGVIYDVALWAVPFGLIGGRVYHVLTDWSTYFGSDGAGFSAALRIWDGGLGIWGAVALGAFGAWIACRLRGIPLPAFGDAIAPGIILAQGIGRLGNYFNQELYGRPTTLPWGLEIYERRNANGVLDSLNGVSTGELIAVVHPTFLYELLWNLLVFAALIIIDRRFRIGHGRLFAMYVAGYCLGRFWIELMRSDAATLIAGVRVNSFTATFVFIGAVVYIMAAPKGREDPATLLGKPRGKADEDTGVEDLVRDVAVAASTTGVVAAAKVAAEEDEADAKEPEPESDESVTPAVGGVGSVEGDEVGEAAEGASEAHDAAVEGEADAEALVAEVDAEESEGDAVDQELEGEADSEAVVGDEADAEDSEAVSEESVTAAVGGVGSVEGDEASEVAEGASEAHEAAVEGEIDAEVLAAGVDAEESEVDAVEVDAVEVDAVEVDEELEGDGAEADEADAEEPESDVPVTAAVGGVGSVEGDEASEVAEGASEAHEAAVEGEADAEELVAEVDAEESEADADADAEEAEGDGAEADGEEPEADVPLSAAVGGVGSVEGDEVGEAAEGASEAHETAVDGEIEAETLAAEVDTEEPEADAESVIEDGDGIAVEGASVAEALEAELDADEEAAEDFGEAAVDDVEDAPDSPDPDQLAAEGASVAEALAAEVEPEPGDGDADTASRSGSPTSFETASGINYRPSGGRVRQWLRRRRNR